MGELVDTLVERFGGGVPRKQCTPRGNGIGERKEKYERDKRKGKTKGLRLLPSAGPWRALTWFKRWLCQIPQQSVAGTVLSPLGRSNRRYHAGVAKVVVLHPFFGREKRSGYERAA